MTDRIDQDRLPVAKAVVDYVVPQVSANGLFHPEESLWAESGVYRSQHARTLAAAGKLLGDDRCVEAAGRMLHRTIDVCSGAYIARPSAVTRANELRCDVGPIGKRCRLRFEKCQYSAREHTHNIH